VKLVPILIGVAALFLVLVLGGAFYTVRETDTVILTQFGRPVGEPITSPGLHWKTPFVQEVHRLEKRLLDFDGAVTQMPTKDKTYIEVDTFARWRIGDPGQFFVTLRDERSADSRLEDIIGSEVRSAVAGHELIEIVRSDKSRVVAPEQREQGTFTSELRVARRGRLELEKDILRASAPKLQQLGIELLDVRIKRVNYIESVRVQVESRMISERQSIAARFRSEGQGRSQEILGEMERELRRISSEAERTAQEIRGNADAEATRVYGAAYGADPEFYRFFKTLESYATLGENTTLMIPGDSDFFRYLESTARPAP
jgi:membrane protease subunit HflC